MAEDLMTCLEVKSSVSSVLNRDHKMYGKKHMFDGTEETCWNSEQGMPQWILLRFGKEVNIKEIQIMFQGGFVGQECSFQSIKENKVEDSWPFYPSDINFLQTFPVNQKVEALRIEFKQSTDFFGRVTIYQLKVVGQVEDK